MDILTILKTIFTLIAVIFLAIFILRLLNKQIKTSSKAMCVMERLQLSNSSSLNIVKIMDEYYLISLTDKNIEVLNKLNTKEIEIFLSSSEDKEKEGIKNINYKIKDFVNKLKRG